MPVFMVEREIPGITMEQLGDAQKSAIETSDRYSAEGRAVRYIRTAWVPSESRGMCFFEAVDAETVKAVNEDAGIPFTRISEALDLTP